MDGNDSEGKNPEPKKNPDEKESYSPADKNRPISREKKFSEAAGTTGPSFLYLNITTESPRRHQIIKIGKEQDRNPTGWTYSMAKRKQLKDLDGDVGMEDKSPAQDNEDESDEVRYTN